MRGEQAGRAPCFPSLGCGRTSGLTAYVEWGTICSEQSLGLGLPQASPLGTFPLSLLHHRHPTPCLSRAPEDGMGTKASSPVSL